MRNLSHLLLLGLISNSAFAMDWTQWRGPDSNGYVAVGVDARVDADVDADVPTTNYPTQLSLEENLVWSINLPGPGASTPIIFDETIYVTCEIDGHDSVCAYDSTGKQLWQQTLGLGREAKHRSATGANPSPVTDGEMIYAYFKSGLLVALSLDGKEAWRFNLQEEFGEYTLWWDLGTSPILTNTGIVVAVMQAEESYLVTFDCKTGEVIWKVDRTYEVPKECDQSYSTPILTEVNGQPTIVLFGADHLTGHNPATGEQLFEVGGFNPQAEGMWRSIASPTIVGDMAYVPYGRGDFLRAINLSSAAKGLPETESQVWLQEGVGTDVPCVIIAKGRIYNLHDKGAINCLELKTGETLWSDKLPRSRTKCFSSPLLLGDLMYCFREDGVGHVARISHFASSDGGWELLSTIELDESIVAQPIPYGSDKVLIRTRGRLLLFSGN